jgi:ribosomal protein S12 methylthiotransferase
MKNEETKDTIKSRNLKAGIISLGCAKNLVNSEQMMYLLSQNGYHVSGETDGADVVVINTCGFIESAKSEAIETILEMADAKQEGRIGKLVVAGCLPQRYKNEILKELPEIDATLGTGSFDDIISAANGQRKQYFGDINASVSETPRIITTSPVWTYLKIAEGCDNRCAFCCIPDIRGKYRSRPMEKIISEAKKLAEAGFLELIIVAQDITRYGVDIYGKRMLPELLTALNEIEKLKWVRLHYLYPDGTDETLIDVIEKSDKIIKYLDIPIQHINDGILRKMNRRGTGSDIRALFKSLRERLPGVVLRTSLIAGLPGEGEEEFEELLEFLSEAKIERAGVFPYSPEEGTKAALMEHPDTDTAIYRAEKIQKLQVKIMNDFNKSRIGSETTVLSEAGAAGGQSLARSYAESPGIDGYIYIKQQKKPLRQLAFIDIRITGIKNGELAGEPL